MNRRAVTIPATFIACSVLTVTLAAAAPASVPPPDPGAPPSPVPLTSTHQALAEHARWAAIGAGVLLTLLLLGIALSIVVRSHEPSAARPGPGTTT
jgi:hypothetical protein